MRNTDLSKYKHFILFFQGESPFHAIGLVSLPTVGEMMEFAHELVVDEDFGIGDDALKLTFTVANELPKEFE